LAEAFHLGGGLIFPEISGYHFWGTSAGTLNWTASEFGAVPKFNGTDTCIFYGGTATANTVSKVALAAQSRLSVAILWKDDDASPAQFNGLAGKTNLSSWTQGWGMFWDSPSKRMKFFIEGYNTNFAYFDVATSTIWHMYVGTWDGATVKLYVDGILGTTDAYSGSITNGSGNGNPIEIGRLGTNTFNAAGQCGGFWVWNRALLPGEAMDLARDPWQMFFRNASKIVRIPSAAATAFPWLYYAQMRAG
jgi:hypothetical protein